MFHLFPDFSLHPFISTPYQTVPKFLLFHLCLPLHRTCSGVCAWWNWSSRCSLYRFASLFPFSWNSSGKYIYIKKNTGVMCQGLQPVQFQHNLTKRNVWRLVLLRPLLCLSACLSFLLSINKDCQTDTHTDILFFSKRQLKWRSHGGVNSSAGCQILIIHALWKSEIHLLFIQIYRFFLDERSRWIHCYCQPSIHHNDLAWSQYTF